MAELAINQFLNMHQETGFVPATIHALMVILVTEIGDKTFFIAAILAMRYGRFIVFLGAMSALALMHILSAVMGFALPNLLPKTYTHYASAFLFVYFGYRLLKDASEMEGGGPSEELHEVEVELLEKKGEGGEEDASLLTEEETESMEEGGSKVRRDVAKDSVSLKAKAGKNRSTPSSQSLTSTSYFSSHFLQNLKIFSQAFTLTFLAEWGDRSQIVTIALASAHNLLGVVIGGWIGHAFCTGVAVIGGKILAARISEKMVNTIGGILFLLFAIHAFVSGPGVSEVIPIQPISSSVIPT